MTVYTHGHHESVLRSHSNRGIDNSAAYLRPFLSPDTRLLDVGAGPGTITVEFAEVVAHVTATEIGDAELALSRTRAEEAGTKNIDFSIEDVHGLSFPDGAFDVVHAHQVLQHVADPVQALREMRRVTRPGGVVAARDADYAGFIWFPLLPELDDWVRLYRDAARANGGEPDAGRRLLSWAKAAGFEDVTATASTWCYATPEERAWWGGCGRTASWDLPSPVSSSTRGWQSRPTCAASARAGGGGRMPRTAGSWCRTGRSSRAPDRGGAQGYISRRMPRHVRSRSVRE